MTMRVSLRRNTALRSAKTIITSRYRNHGIDEEMIAYKRVIELAADTGIPLVLTNDTHYLKPEGFRGARKRLLCIQTGKTLNDKDRMHFNTDQVFFKSAEQWRRSSESPEAYSNTLKIAELCNVSIGSKELLLPHFPLLTIIKTKKITCATLPMRV